MANEKAILEEAAQRYKEARSAWDAPYSLAKEDMAFVYDVDDGHWPEEIRKERAGRPILTVNKLQKFVRQVRGDMMQNRPRVKVIPVDNGADVNTAELYNGIIRQIEYHSNAEIAYDTAYMQAVSSSIGYFRIVTDYVNNDSFEQEIFIQRILNPISVMLDPMAKGFCLEDADYGFIEDLVDMKQYKRLYPQSEPQNFDGQNTLFGDWITKERVRIAEYFYKEPVKRHIAQLDTGEVVTLGKGITIEYMRSLGANVISDRWVTDYVVKWCKINGAEILEESEWAGKYIPIVPVFGDEIIIDGRRYYLSLIRGAKDIQRMYNYWVTAATEAVALTPKMPFIVDHRQIKGFENEWEDANKKNRMYIRYTHVPNVHKPSREPQGQVPAGIINIMQQAAYDIEDHLGRYESSKGEASNERSGKAIIARIHQADKGTYAFVDGLTRALVFCGKQLIDLIPKIYDRPRAMQIMGEDGQSQTVMVNEPVMDGEEVTTQNDLSVGRYDLIASTGASFGSKRQEMTQMLIESMQYAPALAPVIAPLIFKYSDWPGAAEVYGEIRQAIAGQAEQGDGGSA